MSYPDEKLQRMLADVANDRRAGASVWHAMVVSEQGILAHAFTAQPEVFLVRAADLLDQEAQHLKQRGFTMPGLLLLPIKPLNQLGDEELATIVMVPKERFLSDAELQASGLQFEGPNSPEGRAFTAKVIRALRRA